LPANSLLLATIAVGTSVSSITAGNITDKRVYTVATGGIVPMTNVTGGLSGQAGLYADDLSTGRLKRSDGSGNARAPKIAPFAPQSVSFSGSIVIAAAVTASTTTALTVDGVTEVEIRLTWDQVAPGTGVASTDQPAVYLFIDGVVQASFSLFPNVLNYCNGGTYSIFRTPSSGSRVFGVGFSGSGTTGHTFTMQGGILRVSANAAA